MEPDERVNPAMVRLARESRGLTQSALSRLLGVDQAKISRVEDALRRVSSDELESLARALDYPPSFFFQRDVITGPGIGELFHRKRQSVPSRVLAMVHAQINIRRMHIARLLQAVETPERRIPHIDPEEFSDDIEGIARHVRASWNLPPGPIVNLCRAIEDAGGLIVPCDFESAKIDAISQWFPGLPPLFFVNMHVPHDRLRLNLAHELGHLVLHGLPRPDAEAEAMRFAAEFLMPERDVRSSLVELTVQRLASLKLRWRVSMASIAMRARELGRISPSRYRSLVIQMNAAGFRIREPVQLDVREEQPRLLAEIVDAYRTGLAYSQGDLLTLLSSNRADFVNWYQYRAGGLRVVE